MRREGDVPVVSSSGITGYHSEAKAQAPGVVTGRYGTLGEVFYLDQDYWPLNTALYVVDFKGTHPRFAAYFLKHALGSYQSDKAAVPGVNRNVLHELRVRVPDPPEQERIAGVLAAYDDLIENNRRRMKLLEDAARLLYQEWFVRLRFPGHERVRVKDGVPEGWERRTLKELAGVTMGQSPESKYYNENGEGLPFHQGVTDFGDRFVTNRIYTTATNRIANAGDILCSVRAPVGRLNLTLDKVIIGRGLAALRSRTGNQSFLYHQLRTHFFKEDMIGGGAVFASVTKAEFESQKLLAPLRRLIQDFEEVSVPADEQLRVLFLQNQKLRAARDLLLPRLMSGESEVVTEG
jgi:type I restriction enzyme S subunit